MLEEFLFNTAAIILHSSMSNPKRQREEEEEEDRFDAKERRIGKGIVLKKRQDWVMILSVNCDQGIDITFVPDCLVGDDVWEHADDNEWLKEWKNGLSERSVVSDYLEGRMTTIRSMPKHVSGMIKITWE